MSYALDFKQTVSGGFEIWRGVHTLKIPYLIPDSSDKKSSNCDQSTKPRDRLGRTKIMDIAI